MLQFLNDGSAPSGGTPRRVLFLTPSLSLLKQTAERIAEYGGLQDARMLVVGSGAPVDYGGADLLPQTTDKKVIDAFFKRVAEKKEGAIVISTYQSSPLLPLDDFALTVCDEAHRMCTEVENSAFAATLRAKPANGGNGARLFMTATPQWEGGPINMSDTSIFGGVSYRYPLRRGINEGHVNDFRLQFLVANLQRPLTVTEATSVLSGSAAAAAVVAPDDVAEDPSEFAPMVRCIVHAAAANERLLVFCSSLDQMARLKAAMPPTLPQPKQPASPGRPLAVFEVSSAMSPAAVAETLQQFGVNAAAPPHTTDTPHYVLFSCRMVQEGVEIPGLNAVFFAAPRASARDIIQCLCRPLTRSDTSPVSNIYLPLLLDLALDAVDSKANLKRMTDRAVNFIDAVMDEDDKLYSHLVSPNSVEYPLTTVWAAPEEIVGSATTRATTLQRVDVLLRRTLSHGGTNNSFRLLTPARLPWRDAFGRMKELVDSTGTYPQPDDLWIIGDVSISLYDFYLYCRRKYVEYKAATANTNANSSTGATVATPKRSAKRKKVDKQTNGAPTMDAPVDYDEGAVPSEASDAPLVTDNDGASSVRGRRALLEPYQVRDLESLPDWDRVARGGQLHVTAALSAFTQLMQQTKGLPLPADPLQMGFHGASATPQELSCAVIARVVSGLRVDQPTATPTTDGGLAPVATVPMASMRQRLEALHSTLCGIVNNARAGTQTPLVTSMADFAAECSHALSAMAQTNTPAQHAEYLAGAFPGYPHKHLNRRTPKEIAAVMLRPIEDRGHESSHCNLCNKTIQKNVLEEHIGPNGAHQRRVLVVRQYLKMRHTLHYQFLAKQKFEGGATGNVPMDTKVVTLPISHIGELFSTVCCTLCKITCPDVSSFHTHATGSKHLKQYEQRRRSLHCAACNVQFSDHESLAAHKASPEHVERVALKKSLPTPTTSAATLTADVAPTESASAGLRNLSVNATVTVDTEAATAAS
jgi:superfamily II DNA or RNA helicase